MKQPDMHEVGKAAEHLVCADLMLCGYRAFIADAGCPYDVVLDIDGRMIRVQVKATLTLRNSRSSKKKPLMAYVFNPRRGNKGRKRLRADSCDLVALVALDIRAIAYMPVSRCSMTVALLPPGEMSFTMRNIETLTLKSALVLL